MTDTSDETTQKSQTSVDNSNGRPSTEFPPSSFPVTFADSVISFAPANQVVKFYLGRIDPNMFGLGGVIVNPSVQIAMPVNGFLQSVYFFLYQIDRMKEQGLITEEQINIAHQTVKESAKQS